MTGHESSKCIITRSRIANRDFVTFDYVITWPDDTGRHYVSDEFVTLNGSTYRTITANQRHRAWMFPRNGLERMKVFSILAQKEIWDNCGLVLPLFRTSWALPVGVAAVERKGRWGGGERGIKERRKGTPSSLSRFSGGLQREQGSPAPTRFVFPSFLDPLAPLSLALFTGNKFVDCFFQLYLSFYAIKGMNPLAAIWTAMMIEHFNSIRSVRHNGKLLKDSLIFILEAPKRSRYLSIYPTAFLLIHSLSVSLSPYSFLSLYLIHVCFTLFSQIALRRTPFGPSPSVRLRESQTKWV